MLQIQIHLVLRVKKSAGEFIQIYFGMERNEHQTLVIHGKLLYMRSCHTYLLNKQSSSKVFSANT